jgi:hypothetical protein
LGLGAFLGGIPLFYAWWAAVAGTWNHSYDHANTWMVAFLLQVLLGAMLGIVNKWVYLPLAAGMMLSVYVVISANPGPTSGFVLATGWPLVLAGFLGATIKGCWGRYARPRDVSA